jgi:D-glycero-alpha-D-manno-heptose-7-phosphate kinase
MIITRAPLRISFVGGGTDIQEFYSRYPGRVISATIDKFVHVAVNPNTFSGRFIIKYAETESESHPSSFKHDRFREALVSMRVEEGLEIASFADLPAKTGLGSSSSFSVALMKALHAYRGEKISKEKAAQAACDLEINLLKEPIGKQDQYAAAYGGLNMFTFNTDGTVTVEPIFTDFRFRSRFENHMMLFFTGITRSASEILKEQKKGIDEKFETYKQMSDSVLDFVELVRNEDLRGMAKMLKEGWEKKKSLSGNISNSTTDYLYDAAIKGGAWGGKILGAGGGGCLLFIADPKDHQKIQESIEKKAQELQLEGFKRIKFSLTSSGADIIFNSSN